MAGQIGGKLLGVSGSVSTPRVLARLAINLLVLMTARRIRQSFLARRVFPDAVGIWGLRLIEPLELLRCNAARLRSF
jgi:hypothetical protein